MPIHLCAECNGNVSDRASTCPHCGAPIEIAIPDAVDHQDPSQAQSTASGPSWWRCCFEAAWVTLLTLTVAWITATLTLGTPVPFGARYSHNVVDSLIAEVFFLFIFSPVFIAMILVFGTSAWAEYRPNRGLAYQRTRVIAFFCSLPVVPVWLMLLPEKF